jgi:methylase of polypeptide subunit release factors
VVEDPDELDELGDETVEPDAAQRFWALVERREQHEPYPYIIGVTDFRDDLMEIQHGVFLPRFQSEELCDEIEEWVEERAVPRDSWRIADATVGGSPISAPAAERSVFRWRWARSSRIRWCVSTSIRWPSS